jgi:hypothetical protein
VLAPFLDYSSDVRSNVTDAELRDQAVAELKQTTVGYINSKWKVPPAGTHWANALALLAQIGGVTPPPPNRMQLALTSDMNGWTQYRAPALAFGFRLFREEPSNISGVQPVIDWAHANGSKVIAIYRGNGTGPANPLALQADIVEAANEFWWQGASFDIAAYARQMSADADTAHAAGKPYLASILAWCGLSSLVDSQPFDTMGNWKGSPAVAQINAAAPELWEKCAGFAIHPYSTGKPYDNACLDKVRGQLDAIPTAKGKPFYATEFGYGAPATGPWSVSLQTQADWLGIQIDALRARGDVAAACLFRFNDYGATGGDGDYGIQDRSNNPKPAFAVVKARL